MSKINATGFTLSVMDGSPETKFLIAHQTTLGYDDNTATIDVTDKGNNGYADFLGGLQDADISVDFFIDFAAITGQKNFTEVKAYKTSKARKNYVIGCTTPEGATVAWTFNGLITKFSAKLDLESGAMVSMTIKRNGADTFVVTPPVA